MARRPAVWRRAGGSAQVRRRSTRKPHATAPDLSDMRRILLEPLPETIAAWTAAGCPDVFSEVRLGEGCMIVGTIEIAWDGPDSPRPVVRVREVVGAPDPRAPAPLLVGGRFPVHGELIAAVDRAEQARRRSIRPCADCGEPIPPERGEPMASGFTCHGCMEGRHGVVF